MTWDTAVLMAAVVLVDIAIAAYLIGAPVIFALLFLT